MKSSRVRLIGTVLLLVLAIGLLGGSIAITSELHGIGFQGQIVVQGILNPTDAGIFQYERIFHVLKRLTPKDILSFNPAWSPDGKKLAFIYSDMDRNAFHIAILDMKTNRIETILDKGIDDLLLEQDSAIAWSSDGSDILFDVNSADGCHHLYLEKVSEKILEPLPISFCDSAAGKKVYRLDISWSPMGTPLIGVSYQSFYDKPDDIYRLNQGLTKAVWITHGSYPIWRPTTEDFSYLCWKNESDAWPSICQYSISRDSSEVLVEKYGFDPFAWSPDGNIVLFAKTTGESDPVYLSMVNVKTKKTYGLRNLFSSFDQYLIPNKWSQGKVIWSTKN
jgi:Tol biopolymer transport system component